MIVISKRGGESKYIKKVLLLSLLSFTCFLVEFRNSSFFRKEILTYVDK